MKVFLRLMQVSLLSVMLTIIVLNLVLLGVCKHAIQFLSVLSVTFMFSEVWATIQAVTSCNVCSELNGGVRV